ncbi:hypothetical protein WN55_10006 [Dufourea novaeangliae]|uniref:Uncharacterized protein n=1 Tax=Dufourea novaeangliae TaxID=178035 RepID=A0A154P883_DUFNO|nr:hypothetical protein WN55_10006 [Dufourea novaeangliae]
MTEQRLVKDKKTKRSHEGRMFRAHLQERDGLKQLVMKQSGQRGIKSQRMPREEYTVCNDHTFKHP